MVRVLIVDDSAFFRKLLKDLLTEDEEIVVVGEAKNGEDALKKILLLKPDVITLDIEMPYMDGITTLKHIVKDYNIPVIMLSSFTTEGATMTIKALEEGAVDFIPKPSNIFSISGEYLKTDIINKIKVAAKCNLGSKSYGIYTRDRKSLSELSNVAGNMEFEYVIAIGTSTGGPRALQEVIPVLPRDINGSILVVQHMPPKFIKSLADRLNSLSEIDVFEGEDNAILKRGCCYIAPGDFHMRVIYDGSHFRLK
ncbi:MAG: response regulator, partial [Tissierellales bacterium]